MKITIVQGAFLPVPPLLGGAVEKMWFLLGQEFANRGHVVTHVSRCFRDLPAEEMIEGVMHRRVPGYAAPSNLLLLKLRDLLYSLRVRRVLPEADILVSNTFWLPIVERRHAKGRLYVDVQRMPKGQIRLYRQAARLRANSSAVVDAILRECPSAEPRVRMVPNPLPFVSPAMSDPNLRERRILYAGRVHPEKGLDLLIQAFAALMADGCDWQLDIVGPADHERGGGGPVYLERLQREAQGLPVRFHGMIGDQDELNRHYASATVFVYPSLAEKGETFGLAVLEAMALGCVPVVSDLACFRDFVRDNSNGRIFDHRSENPVRTLKDTLLETIADQDGLDRMRREALTVRESHALNTIADKFLEDFHDLAGSTTDER